ncbi:MAG TPA: hypothetical protein VNC50_17715 [Planctomycetia bacterium]|nr:hypothetical protein [Planctomycetia bacterium]
MGAKTWMIVYSDGDAKERLAKLPAIDREATAKLAAELFPGEELQPLEDRNMVFTNPPDDKLYIGVFPGLAVVAAKEFGNDLPSSLETRFLERAPGSVVHLFAMHSVVDWFAFAIWENGTIKRSLSLSPDSEIMEDIGPKLPFEEPFWAGKHPAIEPDEEEADNPYPLPFHPLDFGEAAMGALIGYQMEGFGEFDVIDPEKVALMQYQRPKPKPWWKFW